MVTLHTSPSFGNFALSLSEMCTVFVGNSASAVLSHRTNLLHSLLRPFHVMWEMRQIINALQLFKANLPKYISPFVFSVRRWYSRTLRVVGMVMGCSALVDGGGELILKNCCNCWQIVCKKCCWKQTNATLCGYRWILL